uniref:Uncharacterized protein n=1 Tax=Arundo donax TaxID=35708 RepID=A0A0A8XVH1_ARUDO
MTSSLSVSFYNNLQKRSQYVILEIAFLKVSFSCKALIFCHRVFISQCLDPATGLPLNQCLATRDSVDIPCFTCYVIQTLHHS